MMNKYSHALAKLSLRAANMAVEVSETKEVAEYLLTDIYVDRDTLKELVDRETPMKLNENGNCGNCSSVFEYADEYCSVCGQKTDFTK